MADDNEVIFNTAAALGEARARIAVLTAALNGIEARCRKWNTPWSREVASLARTALTLNPEEKHGSQ